MALILLSTSEVYEANNIVSFSLLQITSGRLFGKNGVWHKNKAKKKNTNKLHLLTFIDASERLRRPNRRFELSKVMHFYSNDCDMSHKSYLTQLSIHNTCESMWWKMGCSGNIFSDNDKMCLFRWSRFFTSVACRLWFITGGKAYQLNKNLLKMRWG